MTVLYDTTLKDTRLGAVITRLGATATLEIRTSEDAVLAVLPLADPAGNVAAGVLTFTTEGMEDASADATGTAAKAVIKDSAGTPAEAITGLTVGLTATDIILDTLDITAGQTVIINTATITHG
ncbi:MAG TPA: hypothetical protein EYQ57_06105 [Methylococcaceae bacterium]|jgi:hypothetical protein|nr:hypothetical protein [Methylococcaceae bacterium]